MISAFTDIDLPLDDRRDGKVRVSYALAGDPARRLFVTTDRISAYDFVLPTPIPDKGRILTAMSLWWFDQLADLVAGGELLPRVLLGGLEGEADALPVEVDVEHLHPVTGISATNEHHAAVVGSSDSDTAVTHPLDG